MAAGGARCAAGSHAFGGMSSPRLGDMFGRRRSRHVPDGIVLESGERPLAVAEGPDTVLTATSHRLIVTDGPEWSWHVVERASWDGDAETLTVITTREGGGQRRYVAVLSAPGRLVGG